MRLSTCSASSTKRVPATWNGMSLTALVRDVDAVDWPPAQKTIDLLSGVQPIPG